MLVRKTMLAVAKSRLPTVVLGGGVAANTALRTAREEACNERHLRFHAAAPEDCTDNAAMIAALGYHLFVSGDLADLELDAWATGSLLNS